MCQLKIGTVSGQPPSRAPRKPFLSPSPRDLDTRGWLTDVNTFVFHMHLPHYAVTTEDPGAIQVLARQPIDMSKPHPFVEAGNSEFNMFLWMPPNGERAGDILLADSTIFMTLFGGDESLHEFLEEPCEQMMQIAGSAVGYLWWSACWSSA